ADWPIRSYSNGQQKKVAICGALVSEAAVLMLDEPFSGGLDPAGIMALKRVLRRRVEHDGATVVMTTPVPELVEELADRIALISDG
ncbi:ATP-binding cassette domain-containing protein, partial [Klebsiella pneumoniae]|nr:ATP-binding cassette domain-containing protein [Klebsiella pneumoniae]